LLCPVLPHIGSRPRDQEKRHASSALSRDVDSIKRGKGIKEGRATQDQERSNKEGYSRQVPVQQLLSSFKTQQIQDSATSKEGYSRQIQFGSSKTQQPIRRDSKADSRVTSRPGVSQITF